MRGTRSPHRREYSRGRYAYQFVADSDYVTCRVFQREFAHAPRLVTGLAQRWRAFLRQPERRELAIQGVRVGYPPIATRVIRCGPKILVSLQVHHQVVSPQDLVSVIVIAGLEPERFVERARASNVLRGKNWFCSFAGHGDLLLMLVLP